VGLRWLLPDCPEPIGVDVDHFLLVVWVAPQSGTRAAYLFLNPLVDLLLTSVSAAICIHPVPVGVSVVSVTHSLFRSKAVLPVFFAGVACTSRQALPQASSIARCTGDIAIAGCISKVPA